MDIFAGRRMPYLRAGHQLPFSADDEEHMAARLDHAIIEWCKKKQMPPRLPRHFNRVKLGQIKLQCQNGRPIVLGSGGLGKATLSCFPFTVVPFRGPSWLQAHCANCHNGCVGRAAMCQLGPRKCKHGTKHMVFLSPQSWMPAYFH